MSIGGRRIAMRVWAVEKSIKVADLGRLGGCLIVMTSGQHLEPMPEEIAYVASKGALLQLTKRLSQDLSGAESP